LQHHGSTEEEEEEEEKKEMVVEDVGVLDMQSSKRATMLGSRTKSETSSDEAATTASAAGVERVEARVGEAEKNEDVGPVGEE